jgi:Putative Actinobacterial Holin-X, holin superfamily III
MITLANRSTADRQSGAKKSGIARGWFEIFKNAFALAGLQLQLFKFDTKEWFGRSPASITTLIMGAMLAMAALPILLASGVVGLSLVGLELVWALLLVGGVGLLLGGLLVFSAITGLKNSLGAFERSRREFETNMAWLNEQLSSHHE